MVFVGFDSDFAGQRLSQFCRISISTGSGRIGQLARRHQGGVGVVSQTRARFGECSLRQWLLDWRGDRAFHYFADLFSLGMAAGICDSGAAGILVAVCLAPNVLPATSASA